MKSASEVRRYDMISSYGGGSMERREDGDWIAFDDYAALERELVDAKMAVVNYRGLLADLRLKLARCVDVLEERERQDAKWGEQNHDPFLYLSILMEEIGEFAQAALHLRYGGEAAQKFRKEAVEVAAVALAIIECIDRKKWQWGNHSVPDPAAVDAGKEEGICGLCGEPGADKKTHPVHWPGEQVPDKPLVHHSCEDQECRRAHAALTDEQRKQFLRSI